MTLGILLTGFGVFIKLDVYMYLFVWFFVFIATHTTAMFIQDVKQDRITVYKAEAVDNFKVWKRNGRELRITLKLGENNYYTTKARRSDYRRVQMWEPWIIVQGDNDTQCYPMYYFDKVID